MHRLLYIKSYFCNSEDEFGSSFLTLLKAKEKQIWLEGHILTSYRYNVTKLTFFHDSNMKAFEKESFFFILLKSYVRLVMIHILLLMEHVFNTL